MWKHKKYNQDVTQFHENLPRHSWLNLHQIQINRYTYFPLKLAKQIFLLNIEKKSYKSFIYQRSKLIGFILCPSDWLFPVKRKVAGEEWLGYVVATRYWGAGIWSIGVHCGGLGMAQNAACSEVEYLKSQVFSLQPHWPWTSLNWVLKSIWTTRRSKQRKKGIVMRRILLHMFRFCIKEQKEIKPQWKLLLCFSRFSY